MVVSPQPGLVEMVLNSAQVPGSRGLWPDTLPTNPVGAVEWPGISWEGLERAFCEPQTPQSFSKYSLPGSLGRDVSFRCGTTASQPSSTHGGRSATVTSLRWSPARGPSVLRGARESLAGEGELTVTGAWAGVRGPTISLSHSPALATTWGGARHLGQPQGEPAAPARLPASLHPSSPRAQRGRGFWAELYWGCPWPDEPGPAMWDQRLALARGTAHRGGL